MSSRNAFAFRFIASVINVCFIFSYISPTISDAQTVSQVGSRNGLDRSLPAPGTMINLSSAYVPVIAKGLRVHPENPILFDFIIDTGNSGLDVGNGRDRSLNQESTKLIKYFLAALTIPDNDQWVNLSPYEKDRIIPDQLGVTEMGRDMLAQDYILKQLTASLIYPEKELGKEFWSRVYAKAQALYGAQEVPVNTFNKVWIVADQAKVYVHDNTAFVVASHLKVMLEEDYVALNKNNKSAESRAAGDELLQRGKSLVPAEKSQRTRDGFKSSMASQVIREIVLPALETEVNQGKNFANLRQIFHSMILAAWYKKNLKEALLNQVYSNKSKINGIDTADKTVKDQIYQQYLKAYKKGVFNYIKEDINQATKQTTPRKYFSGGLTVNAAQVVQVVKSGDFAMQSLAAEGDFAMVKMMATQNADPAMKAMRELKPGKIVNFKYKESSYSLRLDRNKTYGDNILIDFKDGQGWRIVHHSSKVREDKKLFYGHGFIVAVSRNSSKQERYLKVFQLRNKHVFLVSRTELIASPGTRLSHVKVNNKRNPELVVPLNEVREMGWEEETLILRDGMLLEVGSINFADLEVFWEEDNNRNPLQLPLANAAMTTAALPSADTSVINQSNTPVLRKFQTEELVFGKKYIVHVGEGDEQKTYRIYSSLGGSVDIEGVGFAFVGQSEKIADGFSVGVYRNSGNPRAYIKRIGDKPVYVVSDSAMTTDAEPVSSAVPVQPSGKSDLENLFGSYQAGQFREVRRLLGDMVGKGKENNEYIKNNTLPPRFVPMNVAFQAKADRNDLLSRMMPVLRRMVEALDKDPQAHSGGREMNVFSKKKLIPTIPEIIEHRESDIQKFIQLFDQFDSVKTEIAPSAAMTVAPGVILGTVANQVLVQLTQETSITDDAIRRIVKDKFTEELKKRALPATTNKQQARMAVELYFLDLVKTAHLNNKIISARRALQGGAVLSGFTGPVIASYLQKAVTELAKKSSTTSLDIFKVLAPALGKEIVKDQERADENSEAIDVELISLTDAEASLATQRDLLMYKQGKVYYFTPQGKKIKIAESTDLFQGVFQPQSAGMPWGFKVNGKTFTIVVEEDVPSKGTIDVAAGYNEFISDDAAMTREVVEEIVALLNASAELDGPYDASAVLEIAKASDDAEDFYTQLAEYAETEPAIISELLSGVTLDFDHAMSAMSVTTTKSIALGSQTILEGTRIGEPYSVSYRREGDYFIIDVIASGKLVKRFTIREQETMMSQPNVRIFNSSNGKDTFSFKASARKLMITHQDSITMLRNLLAPQIETINKAGQYTAEMIEEQGHLLIKFTEVGNVGTYLTVLADQGFRPIARSINGHITLRVPKDLDKDLGVGIFSMFPWVNRIKDGKFKRNGREIDISKISALKDLLKKDGNNPLHGVARFIKWKDITIGTDIHGIFLQGSFETTDVPGLSEAFGHSKLTKKFYLLGEELITDLKVENLTTPQEAERDGGYEIIADFGEHPIQYFTPGSTTLQMSGVEGVFVVDNLIPTGEIKPLSAENNFSTPQPFVNVDNTFVVKANEKGEVRAVLEDRHEKVRTTYIFSGEFAAAPGEIALVHGWSGSPNEGEANYGVGAMEGVSQVAANAPNNVGQLGGSRPWDQGEIRKARVVMRVETDFVMNVEEKAANQADEFMRFVEKHGIVLEASSSQIIAMNIPASVSFSDPTRKVELEERFGIMRTILYEEGLRRAELEFIPTVASLVSRMIQDADTEFVQKHYPGRTVTATVQKRVGRIYGEINRGDATVHTFDLRFPDAEAENLVDFLRRELNLSADIPIKIADEPSDERESSDRAMSHGGIDLNAKNLQLDVNGQKIDIKFDPAMIAQFKRGDFSGVHPVIINITPILSILPLLGLREDDIELAKV